MERKIFSLRLREDIYSKIKKCADENDESINTVINRVLREHFACEEIDKK